MTRLPGEPPVLNLKKPPVRVVSLVPSLTESLFDLGLGERLAGITDYCIYPASGVRDLPRVGGTKNPHIETILALKPDLVLANWEENPPSVVSELEKNEIPVWVTFPTSVQEAILVLRGLARIFDQPQALLRIDTLERAIEWARAATSSTARRYFCPVWHEYGSIEGGWWMTFNRFTYSHDLLALFGGVNVFAERERRYPLGADLGFSEPEAPDGHDTRYPRVTKDEILAAQPEIILLPSEPFNFNESHRQEMVLELSETPAAKDGKIDLVDGSLITWHGTRLARSLQILSGLFSD